MKFDPTTESTFNIHYNFSSHLPKDVDADCAKAAIIEFVVKTYGLESMGSQDFAYNGYAGAFFITRPRYNGAAKIMFTRQAGVTIEAHSHSLAAEVLTAIVTTVMSTPPKGASK